ncbi:hypothetical protein Mapa_005452 [Marchantia paleacea]|nr:hypothetical protein Mapa_005452 [Marchantia paleacea]
MPVTKATAPPPAISGWQQRASQFYCLIMIFGFPIFSVPCPKGNCTSPLDVVATHAYVKNLASEDVIKGVLYPASTMMKMEVLMTGDPQNFSLPQWDQILTTWNLTSDIVEKDGEGDDFEFTIIPNMLTMFEKNGKTLNWEFVGACIICLLGGFFSIVGPSKYSMWGILLVLWYIYQDGGRRSDVVALPMYLLAFICSLGWINFQNFFTIPPEPRKAPATATPAAATAEKKAKVEFKKKE